MKFALLWLEEKMINKLNEIKEKIYAKAAAVLGVVAIMGLAFIIGFQQSSNR